MPVRGAPGKSFSPRREFSARLASQLRRPAFWILLGLRRGCAGAWFKGTDMTQLHKVGSCMCCGDLLAGRFDRRHVLRAAGGLALFAGLQPFMAIAATGH